MVPTGDADLRRALDALGERVNAIERRHIGEDARREEHDRQADWTLRRTMAYFGLAIAITAVLVNLMNAFYNAVL